MENKAEKYGVGKEGWVLLHFWDGVEAAYTSIRLW